MLGALASAGVKDGLRHSDVEGPKFLRAIEGPVIGGKAFGSLRFSLGEGKLIFSLRK